MQTYPRGKLPVNPKLHILLRLTRRGLPWCQRPTGTATVDEFFSVLKFKTYRYFSMERTIGYKETASEKRSVRSNNCHKTGYRFGIISHYSGASQMWVIRVIDGFERSIRIMIRRSGSSQPQSWGGNAPSTF